MREVIRLGHGWVVGDGRNVDFWTVKLIGNDTLIDVLVEELPEELRHLKVSDLWLEGLGWDMSRIAQFLSEETRLELATVVVDNVTGARDRLSWRETPDVWWAWKWRCGNVFGDNTLWRDRVKFVKEYVKEVSAGRIGEHGVRSTNRQERLISWTPLLVGWTKLNTDGASHGNPGAATAGGVLRNGDGQWCGGFALNIGRCTAPWAELWGVYYGLCIAWEKQVRRLEVEIDSSMVVGFLTTGISDTHPLSFLVQLCYGFALKD
ncbi:unnamed protein product [Microthlaspi erraticum]|uniref:RNase H type-1 domain-containing protein n=1 Tax=Microthlaspi erraticum TaxID=1685480 RepID=A0A6D2LC62_9BRAS|nr:unnamed protein product [Microthlaspi erraticum]